MLSLLQGKNAVVVGVANKHSLAWSIADAWEKSGANVILSYQNGRSASKLQELARHRSFQGLVACDFTKPHECQELCDKVATIFDKKVDIILHSIAYAPPSTFKQSILSSTWNDYQQAHEISTYSLLQLTQGMVPYMSRGGSILTMSYIGSTRVVPHYNLMGTTKASLEALTRQLAYDLGPQGIRVNCLNPGPMNTVSARGIPGISQMIKQSAKIAPLGRNTTPEEVGNVATFLVSELASCVTGQTIYADCGECIMHS